MRLNESRSGCPIGGRRMVWKYLLVVALMGGAIAVFVLPDILSNVVATRRGRPRVGASVIPQSDRADQPSAAGETATKPPQAASRLAGVVQVRLPESLDTCVDELSRSCGPGSRKHELMTQPADWARLREYAVTLEPTDATLLGDAPVVLNGDVLYEHCLRRFEVSEHDRAKSALYVQVGAVWALNSFLRAKAAKCLAIEFLRSRMEYPEPGHFTIKPEQRSGGYTRVVCTYRGALGYAGSRTYSLILRSGQELSSQDKSQFLDRCAMDIALKTMAGKWAQVPHEEDSALARFIDNPHPKTLAPVLKENSSVWVDVPDYEEYVAAELKTNKALGSVSLRPRPAASK
jgi:hypothetical protein